MRKYWLLCENLKLLEQEELYWFQRSHETWLLKGDCNSAYFHKCANGRKRKNTILSLEKDGEVIEGDDNLVKHASEYYSELFGPVPQNNIQLDSSLWNNSYMVSESDNQNLCLPFSEAEIKEALFQMESNKAPGPDKIPIEFYQKCCSIVKSDVVRLFDDFHNNKIDISRMNYEIITLLPKIKEANKIQQYRPICLLNCIYKLVTKVLTLRVEGVADKLINKAQTAFLKGRNILSGVMCLHEIVHETKKRKEVGVILKLDFEKAYDKVNWKLLLDYMRMRGFDEKWIGWISQVISGGTVSIKVNDLVGPYIKSYKGVRQGDPLSPILFNFAANCLTQMVHNAQEKKLFTGLIEHIIPNGVAIL